VIVDEWWGHGDGGLVQSSSIVRIDLEVVQKQHTDVMGIDNSVPKDLSVHTGTRLAKEPAALNRGRHCGIGRYVEAHPRHRVGVPMCRRGTSGIA
jgi:hypothetical protein